MSTTATVVIASIPWTDTNSLLMAPGVLKSTLTRAGITSVALDLNQEARQQLLASEYSTEITQFLLTQEVAPAAQPAIHALFNNMADRILSYNPEWVCLSLLTYLSQNTCRWLCFILKKRRPDIKIVIGGAGCFISLKSIDSFAVNLRSRGLVDYFISGDGEQALTELIQGNTTYPGVNVTTWQELRNLDNLPFPDYTDYNFDLYSTKSVGIWGSRGCVRECTFCDIHEHWSKFQWRSADSIFEEICQQHQQYGITLFKFSDSLINGNQKEYRHLIKLLAEYNSGLSDSNRIRWTSFFIFRPETEMSEEDWRLTAASGAFLLLVGVESFVDHIRDHLKKKFTNRDLDYGLRMAQKHSVNLTLLMIVGYVTETEQDHQEQLEWIRQNRNYAGNPVKLVQVGSTLSILPGTWLDKHREELNIKMGSDEVYQDWTREDIGSTPEVRMRWHQEMVSELEQNGFTPIFAQDNHMLIETYIKKTYATE
jgi:radical SAM superfamily enzyme YgiQ (UPF0313 family)